MAEDAGLNLAELRRYLQRLEDRWSVEQARLAGARLADARGAGAQRERGPEYVLVLVSEHFAGIPWLERVYQATNLWDAAEMGAPVDVHCYTEAELARKLERVPAVQAAFEHGLDLLVGDRSGG